MLLLQSASCITNAAYYYTICSVIYRPYFHKHLMFSSITVIHSEEELSGCCRSPIGTGVSGEPIVKNDLKQHPGHICSLGLRFFIVGKNPQSAGSNMNDTWMIYWSTAMETRKFQLASAVMRQPASPLFPTFMCWLNGDTLETSLTVQNCKLVVGN